MYGVRKCSSFILLQVVDQISQHHLLKRFSLIHCIFLPPLSKIRCPYVRGFFSGLYIPDNELYFKNLCLNLNSGLLESPPHNLNHCVKLSF